MSDLTADEPNVSSTGDSTSTDTSAETATDTSRGAPADSTPDTGTDTSAPTVIVVVTEEPLKPVDVDKIIALHEDESATYRVLVPADTERNMLSSFLNHLSLFEMKEALESLRPVDRDEAHADARSALDTTLAEFAAHDVPATGEITGDDPLPTLVEEVARLDASEVVVVTEPQAVEDTFHRDWASKARETLGLPVLHMYAGDWRLG
jgi:hypothetical protein